MANLKWVMTILLFVVFSSQKSAAYPSSAISGETDLSVEVAQECLFNQLIMLDYLDPESSAKDTVLAAKIWPATSWYNRYLVKRTPNIDTLKALYDRRNTKIQEFLSLNYDINGVEVMSVAMTISDCMQLAATSNGALVSDDPLASLGERIAEAELSQKRAVDCIVSTQVLENYWDGRGGDVSSEPVFLGENRLDARFERRVVENVISEHWLQVSGWFRMSPAELTDEAGVHVERFYVLNAQPNLVLMMSEMFQSECIANSQRFLGDSNAR